MVGANDFSEGCCVPFFELFIAELVSGGADLQFAQIVIRVLRLCYLPLL